MSATTAAAPIPTPAPPAPPALPHAEPEAYFVSRLGSLVAVVVPFLGMLAAITLLWTLSGAWGWLYLGLLAGFYIATALGITIGYHRLFTHRAFKAGPGTRAALAILGLMAVEGPILRWCAVHRRHHQHTDEPGDPHSPHLHGSGLRAWLHGLYHAHFGWLFLPAPTTQEMQRYVPDLAADPIIRRLDRLFIPLTVLGLLLPAAIGLLVTGAWTGALMGLLWGGLLRIFLVHHVTWCINSVCHIWGARPFNTHDESRDNVLFGIIGMGEGWHNTHHAFPTSARHGLRWWQLDISYLIIRVMGLLGLARDIKVPTPDRIEAKRRAA